MLSSLPHISTFIFALAVFHCFLVGYFQRQALKHPEGSILENLFHLLGEVEVVFGVWAGVFLAIYAMIDSASASVGYLESLNFTEPVFVFVIMTIASTRPIIHLAELILMTLAQLIPISKSLAFYFILLFLGPLLGSFITEPAAMTVIALLLHKEYFSKSISTRLKYVSLATLFVNISIGGVLTHYAAPPVLMVASRWNWNTSFMFSHFGWKAVLATFINTLIATLLFKTEIQKINVKIEKMKSPAWLIALHLFFLISTVFASHHLTLLMGTLLFFLGIATITQEFQDEIKLKQSLLVGFFLAGLVVFGSLQTWWLQPLLESLQTLPLFLGSTALTAIMDNAALTYLGSQVPNLSDDLKYALVSGAVTGGGLTVIANAPNPAGYTILKETFGAEGITPLRLFLAALLPTLIAALAFYLL